jgi:aminobenzoyl-glutamate utilization protein A
LTRITDKIIGYRRDFHKHAETGWTEFRTASLVVRRLVDLGYEVQLGREVFRDEDRMGLPEPDVLEACWQRAHEQGGDEEFLPTLRGGFTGVVGTLRGGKGPTVGLRFDMDAVGIDESTSSDHRPARAGFRSINPGAAHACGHDGHTAIGLGIAELLKEMRDEVHGTVKLIFQPAEEGVRGAKAMVAAGVVDGVDYLLGSHLYSGWEYGQFDAGKRATYLATTKFDAFIAGASSHAGGKPNEGKNALLAAATAVLNLQAIPRHREGATRINVGTLTGGTGRNVIPANAHLVIETRGSTSQLNDYVYGYAVRVLEAAAAMHDCTVELRAMGSAQSATSDPELAQRVERIAAEMGLTPRPPEKGAGSEDFTYMMRRVQKQGGQAVGIGIGADLGGWGHHTSDFDMDERALKVAMELLSSVVLDLLQ